MRGARLVLPAARVVLSVTLALACERTRERLPEAKHDAAVAAATCIDTIEAKALKCAGATVSRAGDTLILRLAAGRDTNIVSTTDEIGLTYQYVGRLGPGAFHLIEQIGGDQPPQFILVHPGSGRSIRTVNMPVLSPDSARFAAATPGWDCAESPEQALEIWRFTDSIPVREWRLEKLVCDGDGLTSGWAALQPAWRAPDTLTFIRFEERANRRRPGLAVHGVSGWRLLPLQH
jgi:hypothetical protein